MKESKYPEGGGVYAIKNTKNDRVYFGSGTFKSRWPVHLRLLRQGKHYNKELQADWLGYGEDAFSFEVVEVIPYTPYATDRLREEYYIYNTPNVYNTDASFQLFKRDRNRWEAKRADERRRYGWDE